MVTGSINSVDMIKKILSVRKLSLFIYDPLIHEIDRNLEVLPKTGHVLIQNDEWNRRQLSPLVSSCH